MSIFKKDTTIATYPAYDVVTREADSHGHINISHGDAMIPADHLGSFQVWSVIASALEDNRDPIADYNQEVARGYETYTILALGSTISSSPTVKTRKLEMDFNATYMLEGRLFKIVKQNNNNYGLEAV